VPQVDGFLNVCKPLGWTSHDVVGYVRRRLGQQRVGHAGTLDPAATGVLPLCLGRATRLADRVAIGSKVYAADVRFGLATDSHDADGRAVSASVSPKDPGSLSGGDISAILGAFIGPLEQVPPSYSALKVGGETAYSRARRGESLALAPRAVVIYGAGILGWRPPRLSIVVHCSKGTYVRALARDLGLLLGYEAYLDALVRLAVGSFELAEAVSLEQLDEAVVAGVWQSLVEPADRAVLGMPAAMLAPDTAGNFAYGRAWAPQAGELPCEARAYSVGGELLGLLRRAEPMPRWQPALSFVYDADANTT
jgi:tRNA pseudouridine55 synthase